MRIAPFLLATLLFGARPVSALPSVTAEVAWHGACDDPAALEREMQARGVVLRRQPSSPEASAASRSSALSLQVAVTASETAGWVARLELRDARGGQLRELQAPQCDELRKGVAWVLVVLAEEQALAVGPGAPPSRAAFPAPTTATPSSASTVALPVAPRAREANGQQLHVARPVAAKQSAAFRLGAGFVTGLGLAPTPALGPLLFFQVRPRPGLPELRASLLRLSSLRFERAGTQIEVERLAVRLGVGTNALWAPLSLAANAELGQLSGSGSGSDLAAPGQQQQPWLAFGGSAMLEVPLPLRGLTAEVGAALDYTPVEYSFRYRSGQELSNSGPIEGRLQMGLGFGW